MGNCGAATAAQVLDAEAGVVAGRAGAHFGDGTNLAGDHGWPEAGAVAAGAMEGWPRVSASGTPAGILRIASFITGPGLQLAVVLSLSGSSIAT